MVRTKVFVGNLSFNTKENELVKEFEVAGKVISANIITRGPRSLGYGFVEMDNETDAENAVKLLDKKEVDGRPINVEVAKPREEGADDAQSANAQGSARGSRGGRGGRGGATRGAPRSANGGSDRPPRAPRDGQQAQGQQGQGQQSQGQQGQGQQGQGQQGGQRRQFRRRESDEEGDNGAARGGRRLSRGGRPPRAARPEGEQDNRTPSQTTLFVANLPFTLEDDGFAKVLKDASLAYKTAHVVKKRTGRSKGFGFIEFDNEGDQQKALAALNEKDVEGRPIAVKVALTELRAPETAAASTNAAAPAKTSSPAPQKATSSPAPTKTSTPAPQTEKKEEKPSTPKSDKK